MSALQWAAAIVFAWVFVASAILAAFAYLDRLEDDHRRDRRRGPI